VNTDALAAEIRLEQRPDTAAALRALARFLGRQAARDLIEGDRSCPTLDPTTVTETPKE
jgi:hypothetical protein